MKANVPLFLARLFRNFVGLKHKKREKKQIKMKESRKNKKSKAFPNDD